MDTVEPDHPAVSELRQEASTVHLYWRTGCPFCTALRGRLRRAGLATVEHDIWADPEAAATVRGHADGNETVPTVVIGTVALVNPSARTVLATAAAAGVVPARRRRRRRFRFGLAALLAVVALVAGACGSSSSNSQGAAPAFRAKTVAGGELTSASFDGKPTVLWFWAPWCSVCAREAPDVAAVAKANEGEVTFVGVAGRGKVPAMAKFVKDHGLGFEQAVDADGGIWADYGVAAQPAFAFIDRNGQVTTSLKAISRSELEAKVKALTAA